MIKTVALLLWGVLVLAVFFLPSSRDVTWEVHFKAIRDLPPNHLLQTGDIRIDGLSGRYVHSKISKGELVSAERTDALPAIKENITLFSFSVPASAVQQGSIDAQKLVDLCKDGKKVAEKTTVVAAFCGSQAEDHCIVLASIDPAKSATISVPPTGIEICRDSLGAAGK